MFWGGLKEALCLRFVNMGWRVGARGVRLLCFFLFFFAFCFRLLFFVFVCFAGRLTTLFVFIRAMLCYAMLGCYFTCRNGCLIARFLYLFVVEPLGQEGHLARGGKEGLASRRSEQAAGSTVRGKLSKEREELMPRLS